MKPVAPSVLTTACCFRMQHWTVNWSRMCLCILLSSSLRMMEATVSPKLSGCNVLTWVCDFPRLLALLRLLRRVLSSRGLLGGLEMGLSDDKLADARNVLAGLRCAICHDVFVDPVCGVDCQHVFCSSCIDRALTRQSQCPLCRLALDPTQLRQSQPIQALVNDLEVRCDYRTSGCGWTGRLQDCAAHQAACSVKLTIDCADELDKKAKKFQEDCKMAHARANSFQQESRKLAEELKASTARENKLAEEKAELKDQVSSLQRHVTSLEQRLEEATKLLLESMSRTGSTQVQVFVRDPYCQLHVMNVNIDEDMAALQWYISRQTGWSSKSFYLTGMARFLQPGRTGRDYGIARDATLYMNARMCQ